MVTLQGKVQFWFLNDVSKPEVLENNTGEGTDRLKAAIRSDMTSLQVMVTSARSVEWGSIEAVTLLYLVTWPCFLTYRVKTQDSIRYDSHH
jgi:hypothetical protein